MDNSHQKGKHGKPHEIMSAIISIKCYENRITDKGFFVRCITGYLYEDTNPEENKIKNIFISLLNSSLIDVDKLDYLLRDSFVSGYDNVVIDYIRLLHSVEIKANRFESGFIKEALKKQLIDFPGLSKPKELSKAITLLHSESLERKNFFYLYYKRTHHTAIDLKKFAKAIQSAMPDIEL